MGLPSTFFFRRWLTNYISFWQGGKWMGPQPYSFFARGKWESSPHIPFLQGGRGWGSQAYFFFAGCSPTIFHFRRAEVGGAPKAYSFFAGCLPTTFLFCRGEGVDESPNHIPLQTLTPHFFFAGGKWVGLPTIFIFRRWPTDYISF